MTGLADFLLARIAEDEKVARKAVMAVGSRWAAAVDAVEADDGGEPPNTVICMDGSEASIAHIARHDPTRVLAECDAKRRLITATQQFWDDPQRWDAFGNEGAYEELILTNLALPYVDHPDYRPEWRP